MKRFAIGGCIYRMMLRAELAGSIGGLFSLASRSSSDCIPAGVNFRHESNLPVGRCRWIREVVDSDLDFAISVDADTWFDPYDFDAELSRIARSSEPSVGMYTAPVIEATGDINWRVYAREELGDADDNVIRASRSDLMRASNGERAIAATGFGLVVLDLAWWREHWSRPDPVITSMNHGEDIQLSRGVVQRGGRILPLDVRTTHAAFAM